MIEGIEPIVSRATARQLLFWIGVILYSVFSTNMQYYSGYEQIIEWNSMVILNQMIVAYISIYVLIPQFLMKKKVLPFILWLLLLLYVIFAFYNLFIIHYYDIKYYEERTFLQNCVKGIILA